jgi:hypothetical protein
MKQFFLTLPRNIFHCFTGAMLVWHLVAILATIVLVKSGFDWAYFLATRNHELRLWMFPAAVIGQFVPVVLPLALLYRGSLIENTRLTCTAWAIGQAALIGWFIASAYKSVTGRPHPPRSLDIDTSHIFHFGFWRGGIFWGWPSSHTATAFAVSVTLFTLFPQKKWLRFASMAYAFYIGVGVSMTIHWFSDFVAGAIIGTVIGVTVGKSFVQQISMDKTAASSKN